MRKQPIEHLGRGLVLFGAAAMISLSTACTDDLREQPSEVDTSKMGLYDNAADPQVVGRPSMPGSTKIEDVRTVPRGPEVMSELENEQENSRELKSPAGESQTVRVPASALEDGLAEDEQDKKKREHK